MMFRKLLALGFLAFLFFGLMGFIGRASWARTESAWMQGYLAGQQAANREDGAAAARPPSYPEAYGYGRSYPHFHGHGGFFPGFGLFACLIPLFLFGGFFFLMGRCRRHWHGHGPGAWKHHRHPHSDHHKPPWVDDNDLADEPIMKA